MNRRFVRLTRTARVWRLTARNGQNILSSQGYASKAGCKNGIESVKKNAADDSRYERKTSKANEPYFTLKAGNGQVIGKSEMYSGATAMENGITSVKTNGPTAEVVDNT